MMSNRAEVTDRSVIAAPETPGSSSLVEFKDKTIFTHNIVGCLMIKAPWQSKIKGIGILVSVSVSVRFLLVSQVCLRCADVFSSVLCAERGDAHE